MPNGKPGTSFVRALAKAEPVSVRMKITPEDAAFLLEINAKNRPLDSRRVTRFADIIRRGEWKLTHQGIALSPEGEVLDGQHRLAAIVESGITVEIPVSQGSFDFDVIDTGKNRTAGDVLSIAGFLNTNQLAAALRMISIYDSRQPRPWTTLRRGFTNHQIKDMASDAQEYINDCVRNGALISRRIGGSRSSLAAGLYICRRWALDKGLFEEFAEFEHGLVTGIGMADGDARLALAGWFNSGARRIKSNEQRSEIVMLLVLRSFVAFLRGEVLTRMLISDAAGWTYRLPLRAMKETYQGIRPKVLAGSLDEEEQEGE